MDDLSRILEELERNYITKDQAEKRVLDLFVVRCVMFC